MTSRSDVRVDVCRSPQQLRADLLRDARRGLADRPRWLRPTWFYDDRGCELYDAITRLDSYYPFRRESEILAAAADEIATLSAADTLVEIGSGTSEKTRMLLRALRATGQLRRFVPFDVAHATVVDAAAAIAAEHAPIEVHAIVGDFERDLGCVPTDGRRLIAFLGGTIGNLDTSARAAFLHAASTTMAPGDSFLLGTDLVKDVDRLVAAYDEPEGVTAAFNLNVLAVLNRQLGATFDLHGFEHVARYDAAAARIEMRLRSLHEQVVALPALEMRICFEPGEEVLTEISTKFTTAQVRDELAAAGLAVTHQWTDPAGDYALTLAVR